MMIKNDRHAWMIMVHNHPEQLFKLCSFLDHGCNDIYIHVDKKVLGHYPMEKISVACNAAKVEILTEPLQATWGGYSLVLTELRLLDAAVKDGRHLYYHLLSGVDLPIKSFEYIYDFLEKNSGNEFVSFQRNVLKKQIVERYYVRHLIDKYGRETDLWSKILRKFDRVLTKIQLALHIYRNDKSSVYRKGAQWFSITEEFANYVISPFSKKWIGKYCTQTMCPDEFFLQTLLYNSEFYNNVYYDSSKGNKKCYACLRYIDWDRGAPYTFNCKDTEELMSAPDEALFARKFDEDMDAKVIDEIYARVM